MDSRVDIGKVKIMKLKYKIMRKEGRSRMAKTYIDSPVEINGASILASSASSIYKPTRAGE